MDLLTSVNYELELWSIFASSRGANATVFLAMVIAVWIAARFSSVMVDKGANTVANVIGTVMMHTVLMTAGRGNMTLYTNGTNLLIYETITSAAWRALEWDHITHNSSDIWISGTYTVQ